MEAADMDPGCIKSLRVMFCCELEASAGTGELLDLLPRPGDWLRLA